MLNMVKNELYKVFHLRKFYLFMGVVLALQLVKIFQHKFLPQEKVAFPLNGQSFPLEMIGGNSIIMVMFIAVLAADMIADEYKNGTFKLVLLHPVSRIQFIGAKAAALMASIMAITCFTVITSYITGAIAFDWGNLLLFQGVPIAGNSIAITLKSALASILPGVGFGMLVIFIALMTENVGITIGAAVALYIISPLLERYGSISNYSIIYLMNTFHEILINSSTQPQMLSKVGVIAAYVVLFYTSSAVLVKRKDVLL
jgi:ABC-2 type transport system permease protein